MLLSINVITDSILSFFEYWTLNNNNIINNNKINNNAFAC